MLRTFCLDSDRVPSPPCCYKHVGVAEKLRDCIPMARVRVSFGVPDILTHIVL
jgi:hypothetical protein